MAILRTQQYGGCDSGAKVGVTLVLPFYGGFWQKKLSASETICLDIWLGTGTEFMNGQLAGDNNEE